MATDTGKRAYNGARKLKGINRSSLIVLLGSRGSMAGKLADAGSSVHLTGS